MLVLQGRHLASEPSPQPSFNTILHWMNGETEAQRSRHGLLIALTDQVWSQRSAGFEAVTQKCSF